MTDSGNNPRAASSKGDDTTTLQQQQVSKPDRIDHGLEKNDTHPRSGELQKRAAFQQFTETQSARGIPLRGGPPGTVNPIATPTEQHAAVATASTIPPSTQKQGPNSLTTDPEEEAEFDGHSWLASEMR